MMPWLNQQDLDNVEDTLLDFDLPLGACTAQEISAGLLLWQRDPLTMDRVLQDLGKHSERWHSFFSYPAVPSKPQRNNDPGALTVLRDVGQGWTANTLYLLAIDYAAAAILSQLARQWAGAKATICSLNQTQRLIGSRNQARLVIVEWTYPLMDMPEEELEVIYDVDEPPDLIVESNTIAESSVQQLIAGPMLMTSDPHFHAPTILETLQDNPTWWNSFLMGPRLTGQQPAKYPPLQVLEQQLPRFWCNDCLYIWTRSDQAARQLQQASEHWLCDTKIISNQRAAHLLNFPQASPIVVMSWD
ncbi:hypothetical protein [Leptolyngbya ohadii]|uniref:hypothetical protein n=1 Tax=Leptolyngbya ohadii TaxID=1962290 RepID=UPI00117A5328|nr:hypothetical protein [Leptolyngbya ohadii]